MKKDLITIATELTEYFEQDRNITFTKEERDICVKELAESIDKSIQKILKNREDKKEGEDGHLKDDYNA